MVNTNRLRVPQTVLPLGLCLVAASAEAAGHRVATLDLCFRRSTTRIIRNALRDFQPDVVGLSIRNLDNSDAQCPKCYVTDLKRLVEVIRAHHAGLVVIGGPAVSIAPDALLARLGVDYALVGEGEVTFPEFLNSVENGRTPDAGVVHCARVASRGMLPSSFPTNALNRLDLARYAAYGTPIPIQTRRGCAMKCVYCTYPAIEGSCYRLKAPRMVADEIQEASSLPGLRSVEFVDSVFNHPLDHAVAVCEELEIRRNRLPLYTASINPSVCDTGLFRLMERAGFTAIASSLESASDEVLASLQKGYTARDVAETLRAARMTSMARMWIFVLGAPGETERTARETLEFIGKYISERDYVMITCGLRIYPGTELERIARREGVLDGSEDLLDPAFYFSPGIGREGLLKLIRKVGLPNAATLLFSDISSAVLPAVQRVHTMLGMPPPYWRHSAPLIRVKHVLG